MAEQKQEVLGPHCSGPFSKSGPSIGGGRYETNGTYVEQGSKGRGPRRISFRGKFTGYFPLGAKPPYRTIPISFEYSCGNPHNIPPYNKHQSEFYKKASDAIVNKVWCETTETEEEITMTLYFPEDVEYDWRGYTVQLTGLCHANSMYTIKALVTTYNIYKRPKFDDDEKKDFKGISNKEWTFDKDDNDKDIKKIVYKMKNDTKIKHLLINTKGDIKLIVFIHGINTQQQHIIGRLDKIDAKLDGKCISILFNWKCKMWRDIITKYKTDQEMCRLVTPHFIEFIQALRSDNSSDGGGPAFTNIDFVAHSMGNYLFSLFIRRCIHLNDINKLNLCLNNSQIICIAADIDIDEYSMIIKQCKDNVKTLVNWTHYYHTKEIPLNMASISWRIANGKYRAGTQSMIDHVSNYNIFDAVKCNSYIMYDSYIDNNQILNDLQELILNKKLNPGHRHNIRKQKGNGDHLWVFVDENDDNKESKQDSSDFASLAFIKPKFGKRKEYIDEFMDLLTNNYKWTKYKRMEGMDTCYISSGKYGVGIGRASVVIQKPKKTLFQLFQSDYNDDNINLFYPFKRAAKIVHKFGITERIMQVQIVNVASDRDFVLYSSVALIDAKTNKEIIYGKCIVNKKNNKIYSTKNNKPLDIKFIWIGRSIKDNYSNRHYLQKATKRNGDVRATKYRTGFCVQQRSDGSIKVECIFEYGAGGNFFVSWYASKQVLAITDATILCGNAKKFFSF